MKKEELLQLGLTEDAAQAVGEAMKKELAGYVSKEKYDALEAKYQADTDALTKQLADTAKHNAVDLAILKAGGKNTKAIKALLDMEKISLKEDGTLEGLDLAALQASDGYLFTQETKEISGTGMTKGVENGENGIAAAFERAVMG